MRARDLGLEIGVLPPGPNDAITDVEGVRVGHSTIIRGEGPLVVGEGPVRTGVTVVCPREGPARDEPVFAGCHRFNGNGEMTGLEWIREAGALDHARRHHQHPQRRRRARRPDSRRAGRTRRDGGVLVPAGRGRDLRRDA